MRYEKETLKMKPMILTIFAALSLMAAQNSTPAGQAPAKGSTSAPAASTPAPAEKKVVKHKKHSNGGTSTSTSSNKPASGDSSKPAAPVSKSTTPASK